MYERCINVAYLAKVHSLEHITIYAQDIEPVTCTEKIRLRSSSACQSDQFVFAITTDTFIYKCASETILINFNLQ